jgi:hypothetical protein
MCVGLNCEYTDAMKNVKESSLPPEKKQRAAVLQLSMVYETLVFEIYQADAVPGFLRGFLRKDEIMFWCTTIHRDVPMLEYYRITISGARPSTGDPQPNPQLSSRSITTRNVLTSDVFIMTPEESVIDP